MNDVTGPRALTWKSIRPALVIAGAQLVGALLLVLARKQGLISFDTTVRGAMVLIGLSIAATGNRIPKMPDGLPPHTLSLAALRQSVLRIAGWAMMLGGLAFAGFWAFAPRDVAAVGSIIALGGSLAVMCGFVTWWIFAYHHRSPPS